MAVHNFTIRFPDGAFVNRAEWGKNRADAFKTICSIYGEPGKDFWVVK